MIDPGRIEISVRVEHGLMAGLGVRSTRPMIAAALRGLSIPEALKRIGLFFPLCGMAHAAALGAAARAAGASDAPVPAARSVLLEQALAFAWRFGIDLPAAIGAQPDLDGVARFRKAAKAVAEDSLDPGALAPLMAGLIHHGGLSENLLHLARDLDARGFGLSAWPALGERPASWFAARLAGADDFTALPEDDDGPAEVGIGAGARPVERLRAQIAAAMELPDRIARADTGTDEAVIRWSGNGAGAGTGLVQTARGPLAYRLERGTDGHIAHIASVAPTEWNFHPDGPCMERLAGAVGPHDPALVTRFIAALLDPCVPVRVTVCRGADAAAAQLAGSEVPHA